MELRGPVDLHPLPLRDTQGKSSTRGSGGRIRCPKCHFEPSEHDRWQCSCLHLWNTFLTGGRCPACGLQWEDTACPRCHQWSRHVDWYDFGEGPEA